MSCKKNNIVKKILNVSIVTINQLCRSECLKNLYKLIKLQTYKNIKEWIIVEGSKNIEDATQNAIYVENIIKNNTIENMKIIYVKYSGKKLSDLRNISNNNCSQDIIVVMDDDDYYPPQRVEHAVDCLQQSNLLIAGCSDIYIYEYCLTKLYKFKRFHQNHSTNNCMAYKKEYLKNHSYESNLDMDEEKSFTNNFTEQMIQLQSIKCIIVSSHNMNTFNNRQIYIGGSCNTDSTLIEVTEHELKYYIPDFFVNSMKQIFVKEERSIYDIVYYTGAFNIQLNPKDKSNGGSEQAIINLSEMWAKKGLKIAVYANITKDFIHNLVEYKKWETLNFNHIFNKIILWRTNGFISSVPFNLQANTIYWDLHDNFIKQDQISLYYKKYGYKITKIMVKSKYHLESFENYFKVKLSNDQYCIIPNGILVDKFSKNWDSCKRNPYRFCYVSYYTRGLLHIIPNIWYIIKQMEPRAELHLYYGMEMFTDENLIKQLKMITAFPGVIDHGRQSIDMIVREKYLSSFQLYITNTIAEIDCISIRESLVTGCIPLISNFGIFAEREGIHFELKENDTECMKQIAINIVNILKNQDKNNILRDVFKKSSSIISWDEIAELWLS